MRITLKAWLKSLAISIVLRINQPYTKHKMAIQSSDLFSIMMSLG